MMTTNDVARVYDTILSTPGMNENIKLDLKISRKQVLLLTQVIERGLKDGDGLLTGASKESVNELYSIARDCLEKAGLTEVNAKLSALQSK